MSYRRTNASLIPFIALLVGCATTPAGQKVELRRVSTDSDFLTWRNRVEGKCLPIKTETFGADGGPAVRTRIRNYAATIGADTVVWREYNESPDRLSHADFYRCHPAPEPTKEAKP